MPTLQMALKIRNIDIYCSHHPAFSGSSIEIVIHVDNTITTDSDVDIDIGIGINIGTNIIDIAIRTICIATSTNMNISINLSSSRKMNISNGTLARIYILESALV